MLESFSASGFLVHTPCGPRKSGMPESVEMPAPVRTTMRPAASTQPRTRPMTASRSRSLIGGILYTLFVAALPDPLPDDPLPLVESWLKEAAAVSLGRLSRVGRARGVVGQPARARARSRAVDAHAHARRRGVDGRSVARHALDAMTLPIAEHVPLGPLTTLGVGGAARWFVEA